ncbi:tyrosine-type recombinase/integrase, partial [Aliarcobacter butzleri]|uniref:tyrosine-type recombinase/integrase n=1 Tax=Aliarcobacter butzleri TaxID=28197 RepID=UPI003AF9A516
VKANSSLIQSSLKPIVDNLFNNDLVAKDTKIRFVIHSLRHTFASHLAINGSPIFTIKELMYHKDIEQTMRYAKLAP